MEKRLHELDKQARDKDKSLDEGRCDSVRHVGLFKERYALLRKLRVALE